MPEPVRPRSDARAWVEVDLAALVRNARALAAHARVPLVPMVKADAYGLGAVRVARALEEVDPFAFGVSSIEEAIELRDAGITRPIVLYTPVVLAAAAGGWHSGDAARLVAHRVTPTLGTAADIEAWRDAAEGAPYHLAVDTGMHRAGIEWHAVGTLRDALRACPPVGVLTHFHSSEADDGSLARQEARFAEAVAALPARPRFVYTDNSGAVVRRTPNPGDLVRPGVFLYGVGSWPADAAGRDGPRVRPEPVVALRARVLEVREIAVGEGVSYNVTWHAERPTRIATVACGYADGLRRPLGNRAHGLLRGRPVPIRGVVTMDLAMLDVTDVPCDVGDVVTFLGRDGDALRTVEQVAAEGGLSPYELLVGLKLRLPRVYTGT